MLSPPKYRTRNTPGGDGSFEVGWTKTQHTLSQLRTGTPQQSRRAETSRCMTQDHIGTSLQVRQTPGVMVKRFISSPSPTCGLRDRSPSPEVQIQVGKPQHPKVALDDSEVSRSLCFAQNTQSGALQTELKDLKNILEKQYSQDQQFAALGNTNLVADAANKVQQVQKATSVAPEGKFRELCANVACQQAEQEVFIRMLKTSMEDLQQQVKNLRPASTSDMGITKQELVVMQERTFCGKSSLDTETKQFCDNIDGKMSKQAKELKSWFAEFCVLAMKETLGEELQRHAEAIQYLNTQVDSLNDATKHSLASMRHSEAIKSLNLQVDYLNEVTTQSLAALQALIKQVVSGALADESSQNGNFLNLNQLSGQRSAEGFARKLDPIAEASVEGQDTDTTEIPTWVKTIYQDALTQSSSKLVHSESEGCAYPEQSKGA